MRKLKIKKFMKKHLKKNKKVIISFVYMTTLDILKIVIIGMISNP